MSLDVVWFLIIAVFWVGFLVLEGFDFGVGMLHQVVGRTDVEQRVAINTIGPWWDGNEVWLIVGGAAIFAAFPSWYATWFSAGYLALVLILVALMARGVAFEYRGKGRHPRWPRAFSACLTWGSLVAPLLLGVALGDLLAGLPVNSDGDFTGTFFDLLTPYGLWTGITVVVLCLLHGATFLGIRTDGAVHLRAQRTARRMLLPALLVAAVFGVWTLFLAQHPLPPLLLLALAVIGLVVCAVSQRDGRQGRAFTGTALAIGAGVAMVFASLYPNVLVSSTTAANNLTVADTASSHYALTVMTVVAVIFFPIVLLYQGWTFWVFRHRVHTPPEDAALAEH